MHSRFILATAITVLATLSPILSKADGASMDSATKSRDEILWMLGLKRVCDLNVPGFKEKSASAYAEWRQSKIQIIQEIERDPNFRLPSGEQKNTTAQEQAEFESFCNNSVLENMHAPDSRFSSYEKTLDTFLTALRSANRKLALSCLTSSARDNFKPMIETISEQELAAMGSSIKGTHITMDLGAIVEIGVVRNDGRAGSITLRDVSGEWKISDM